MSSDDQSARIKNTIRVTMDPLDGEFTAYVVPGEQWNGWLVPYFDKFEALRLMAVLLKQDFCTVAEYRRPLNAFMTLLDEEPRPTLWRYNEEHKGFAIGGHSWCWYEALPEDFEDDGDAR